MITLKTSNILPLPLTAIQILWISPTDGLSAIALGIDSPGDDVVKRKPETPSQV